ncbi:ABC transporter ATP-binding protein [Bradyrhizobium iriomotense]|uniref:ABC transporter ATP-binding protein n=1 Tax=Bradyrhizobium iriomotense TaxID=441950 RepID=UPI001B89FBB3|nr:ABC transporter ATP-binding protein [Bradyrhizobium iriomotense]MBR1133262.1 ABC transporter ATP-binding protein [Bradyrhizobium iriomotense]
MSSEPIISLRGVGKCYNLYDKPTDRLKQMLANRLPGARRKFYREHWALRGVSLDIASGETVGIIGQNGSGKSTLLQLICGTLMPTEGEVRVKGRIAPLLQLGAGFNPEFTGRENVALNAAILGLSAEEIDARFDDIVAFADIGEMLERPVKLYSSGMYARLAFAVAINVDPEILIVDEALAVGDEGFQVKCYGRIRQIRDSGATVLFVSHARSTIVELCDRAVLLDSGKKLLEGEPKPVMAAYQKYLFAPEQKKPIIRAAIERGDNVMPEQRHASHPVSLNKLAEPSEDVAAYDVSLVVNHTEEWPSRGARISNACIRSMDGRKVNVLAPGATYIYEYTVEFQTDAFGVSFGMLTKTLTGLEIAGIASHPAGSTIDEVRTGEQFRVRFHFNTALTPGTYTFNAGCFGLVDGAEVYLHRLVDAVVFRVMPARDGRRISGYFDIWSTGTACTVEAITESVEMVAS